MDTDAPVRRWTKPNYTNRCQHYNRRFLNIFPSNTMQNTFFITHALFVGHLPLRARMRPPCENNLHSSARLIVPWHHFSKLINIHCALSAIVLCEIDASSIIAFFPVNYRTSSTGGGGEKHLRIYSHSIQNCSGMN